MKLSEWNKVLEHADNCANILNVNGYSVRATTYTMYDGRKGVYLQLFDDSGKFFKEYASGIRDTAYEYMLAIDNIVKRIQQEV